MAFFADLSPTSSGFAVGKKIRYDRGNKTEVEEREVGWYETAIKLNRM